MKTFQQFLMEAMESKSANDSQLDKDALAMYKALWFKDSDSDQSVYKILHAVDKFYKNLNHDGFSKEGAAVAHEFTFPPMIFWILETCCEVDELEDRLDVDDIHTVEQARDDDDFDNEYNIIQTEHGGYVFWDYNLAYNDKDINNWTLEKIKKVIKMMCDLHHVKYNEEVFKKFDPEDFTNSSYNPIESHRK